MILALDTSTALASVALYDGAVSAAISWRSGRNHPVELIQQAISLMALRQLTVAQLTAVAVATGPGPSAGLGVGRAGGTAWCAARGLGRPWVPARSGPGVAGPAERRRESPVPPAHEADWRGDGGWVCSGRSGEQWLECLPSPAVDERELACDGLEAVALRPVPPTGPWPGRLILAEAPLGFWPGPLTLENAIEPQRHGGTETEKQSQLCLALKREILTRQVSVFYPGKTRLCPVISSLCLRVSVVNCRI